MTFTYLIQQSEIKWSSNKKNKLDKVYEEKFCYLPPFSLVQSFI